MSGVVLKSHHGSTSEVAALISGYIDDFHVFGGVTLNMGVGGLNPYAVEACFGLGGKLVWLPTKNGLGHGNISQTNVKNPISIVNERGEIKSEIAEITAIIHANNGVLATGHISREEIFILHKYLRRDFPSVKMLINHSLFLTPNLSLDDVLSLSDNFTYMECCHLTVSKFFRFKSSASISNIINQSKNTNWIVATDSGQPDNFFPAEALSVFYDELIDCGVSLSDMERYTSTNPEELLLL